MKRENPVFLIACQNVAALVWSAYGNRGLSPEFLWKELPDETKKQIEDFVALEKKGPTFFTDSR